MLKAPYGPRLNQEPYCPIHKTDKIIRDLFGLNVCQICQRKRAREIFELNNKVPIPKPKPLWQQSDDSGVN